MSKDREIGKNEKSIVILKSGIAIEVVGFPQPGANDSILFDNKITIRCDEIAAIVNPNTAVWRISEDA